MPRPRKGIEDQLTRAQAAINNTIADPDLYAALSAYGYTTERLRQGSALCQTARAFYQRQKNEYGALVAANNALDAAQRQTQDLYMRHVKAARVALRGDRGPQQKLGLSVQRKRRLAAWLEQAQQFYANALADADILNRLAVFDLTQAMLVDGQRRVEAVAASLAARMQHKGAAQDATSTRDSALAALAIWMGDFLKIARVALQDRPQLLEKLGVAAPRRRAAHPAAPTTATAATPMSDGAAGEAIPDDPSPAVRRSGRAMANGRRT
jgi:hypothetical protein